MAIDERRLNVTSLPIISYLERVLCGDHGRGRQHPTLAPGFELQFFNNTKNLLSTKEAY
jgi:hypothetical protein